MKITKLEKGKRTKIIAVSIEVVIISFLISAWLFLPPWDAGQGIYMILWTILGLILCGLCWLHKDILFNRF